MKTQNRKEIFLKALANGEEANIKPLTREEVLLKKQAQRESASGGGGGGITIVNLTVDYDANVATCDMTAEEIFEMAQNSFVMLREIWAFDGACGVGWYVFSSGDKEADAINCMFYCMTLTTELTAYVSGSMGVCINSHEGEEYVNIGSSTFMLKE